MLFYLIFAFTVVPLIELYFLFEVADVWGGWNTFMVVLATGIIGGIMAKSQGREVLVNIQQKMATGEFPNDELIQGAMVLVGGVLLITPGFITDATGLILIIPFTRNILVRIARNTFKRAIDKGNAKFYSATSGTSSGGKGFTYYYQSYSSTSNEPPAPTRDVTPQKLE